MYHDERFAMKKEEELKSLLQEVGILHSKMDSETLESLGWEPFQLNILKRHRQVP